MDNQSAIQQIGDVINRLGLDAERTKAFLRQLVEANWPGLPVYSTLKFPKINEVETATVGTGVVPTFRAESGNVMAVVVKAGTHYQGPRYAADPLIPTYMIAGGFLNLTHSPATQFSAEILNKPEDPRVGAVREAEEELVDDAGKPVLAIDPSSLLPMDTKMLSFPWGEKRLVIGFMVPLNPAQVLTIKSHVARLEVDDNYRHAVRNHTINKDSDKPEICTVSILPLEEIASGRHVLLHRDQISLFQRVAEFYAMCRGPI